MRDDRLERDVSDELRWDPKVDEAGIAVTVYEGDVTLRGTVGSLAEKLEAKKAAERVRGVTGVHNDLEVRIMDDVHRADADLRGDVLRAASPRQRAADVDRREGEGRQDHPHRDRRLAVRARGGRARRGRRPRRGRGAGRHRADEAGATTRATSRTGSSSRSSGAHRSTPTASSSSGTVERSRSSGPRARGPSATRRSRRPGRAPGGRRRARLELEIVCRRVLSADAS